MISLQYCHGSGMDKAKKGRYVDAERCEKQSGINREERDRGQREGRRREENTDSMKAQAKTGKN